MTDHLLTPEQVAERLQVSPRTVHRLAREGKIAYVPVSPKKRRFSEAHVQEFLDSREVRAMKTVDKKPSAPLPSHLKSITHKGGETEIGVSGTDLRKGMRSW